MSSSLLSKYFPPPKFLKPLHIGMSFSDLNIKAIFFDKTLPKPTFKSVIVPLERGAISEGTIQNMEEVVKKLSSVRESFDSRFVFFTIPDEIAYVFSVSAPLAAAADATESVAFTIEENVPLSLPDTVFDFMPIKLVKNNSDLEATYVVAACVKKEEDKFLEALEKSGFEPVGSIHESQAIANALAEAGRGGSLCIAHVRSNRVGIYLVKDGLTHFSTLRQITEGDYEKQFLDEYQKFFEYCFKYDPEQGKSIKDVLVCGEFQYAEKAVEAIRNYGGNEKNAKLANAWQNVLKIEKSVPSIKFEDSLNFAGPIGAVLSSIT